MNKLAIFRLKKDKITNDKLRKGLNKIKKNVNIKGSISNMNKDSLIDMYSNIGYEYVGKKKFRLIPVKVNSVKKYPLVIDL